MDDFYKQIKESLNALPEPAFRGKDWRALSADMDSKKLSPAAFWGWLAAPVLISLAMLAWWHYGPGGQDGAGTFTSKTDTVYITRTIRQLDTVYIEKSIFPPAQLAQNQAADAAQMRQMQREITVLRKQLTLLLPKPAPSWNLGKLPIAETGQGQVAVQTGDNTGGEVDMETYLTNRPVAALIPTGYTPLGSPPMARLPIRKAGAAGYKNWDRRGLRMDWLMDEIREINVNPLQLGASTGLFYPTYGSGDYRIGRMAGIQALMPLTDHLQAESNLMYQNAAYETRDLDETGGTLPLAEEENLRFLKVEAPYKSLQWDIGINYAFNDGGVFQPKLGVGYGLIYYYLNELSYEFENQANGATWSIENGGNQNGFRANSWLLKTGGDLRMNSDWVLTVSGMYRVVNGTETFLAPSYWSYGLGLRYKF